MQSPSRQLGELLVDRNLLSRAVLEEALVHETATGMAFAKYLTTEDLVSQRDLVAALATQLGYQFWDTDRLPVEPGVEDFVPAELARRLTVVPLALDGGRLMVAMEDPSNQVALDELASATGLVVAPILAMRSDVVAALNQLYPLPAGSQLPVASMPAAPGPNGGGEIHLSQLLAKVVELGASDLHVTVGVAPTVRVDGMIIALDGFGALDASTIRRIIYEVLPQRQRDRFETELELDTSYSVPNVGRFRVNVFMQRSSVGAVLRAIPFEIVPLAKLGVPEVLQNMAELHRGLVLVTGPTGSGKSTTLASMVDVVNSTRQLHIMTVEDPIEFLHQHKASIVNQREVGEDTRSFAQALKHVLRQDPDVILVGELRDLETISTALTAAETGHLVFATLHTSDAPQSIDRIIDVFPPHQQQQIRIQLGGVLQGVVCQQLVPRRNATGRVAACEVLIVTPAVRNLIREGKTHQIYSTMQAGGRFGMQTMDQALAALVKSGKITMDEALERCANQDDVVRLTTGSS